MTIIFFKWAIPWTDRYINVRLIGEYNWQAILADIHRRKEEEVDDVWSDREKKQWTCWLRVLKGFESGNLVCWKTGCVRQGDLKCA